MCDGMLLCSDGKQFALTCLQTQRRRRASCNQRTVHLSAADLVTTLLTVKCQRNLTSVCVNAMVGKQGLSCHMKYVFVFVFLGVTQFFSNLIFPIFLQCVYFFQLENCEIVMILLLFR